MKTPFLRHTSYILRIWKDDQCEEYRYTLQDVLTGEYRHFANLRALYHFLASISEGSVPRLVSVQEEI
jgi:hypothetical protein